MTKAVIDKGNKEMAAGRTFVSLSRLKIHSGIVIQPMTFQRLKSIGQLKCMQQRITEEHNLSQIAQNINTLEHQV